MTKKNLIIIFIIVAVIFGVWFLGTIKKNRNYDQNKNLGTEAGALSSIGQDIDNVKIDNFDEEFKDIDAGINFL